MKAIKRQSIGQSLREGLTTYLNEGFVSDDGEFFVQEGGNRRYPTEDAISYLGNWIESTFNNDDEEDKGTIEDWKDICIIEFIHFLELEIGASDDESMYEMIKIALN